MSISYEDLVDEIKERPITQLPALLIVITEQCLLKKVFVDGGLLQTVSTVVKLFKKGGRGLHEC